MSRCAVDGAPVNGATLCTGCQHRLEVNLGDLAGLIGDLELTFSRQTANGPREGSRAAETPLPYNDVAAKLTRRVHTVLGTWVRDVHDGVESWPADDDVAFSRWLLSRHARLARHPAAEQISSDIAALRLELLSAVDRNPERWYAGPCAGTRADGGPCVEAVVDYTDDGRPVRSTRPTELYATPEARVVTCRRCGTAYDVAERRQWLLDVAQDQLAHAELIGRAAPALGVDITPAAVRGYADRGRIVAHGTDQRGRPLYRVGDVIEVARDVLARRSQQKTDGSRRSA